jgi:four helix bundle protein
MKDERKYDLETRTFLFAKSVRSFIKRVPMTLTNVDDCRQLGKASGSVGANYIEANESISRKEFDYRIKICRKEAKESTYFQRLIDISDRSELQNEQNDLIQEATELTRIFGSKVSKRNRLH